MISLTYDPYGMRDFVPLTNTSPYIFAERCNLPTIDPKKDPKFNMRKKKETENFKISYHAASAGDLQVPLAV